MALFSRKNDKETAVAAAPKKSAAVSGASIAHRVLIAPRITEKATNNAANNVYTFNVALKATKTEVSKAIKELYKVVPRKVRIVNTRGKSVTFKGKQGKTAAMKKAYVYLAKGETIELV